MANLTITVANVLASKQAQINNSYNFGATITPGEVVYLDSGNLWQLADSNASATTAKASGITLNGGSAGQPASVCTSDPAFTPGATVAAGVPYVVSETAGLICPSTDLATGDITCFLFLPITGSTTQVNFQPVFGGGTHA